METGKCVERETENGRANLSTGTSGQWVRVKSSHFGAVGSTRTPVRSPSTGDGKKRGKTYNIEDSLVVTDPTTSSTLTRLSRGERTGSRVLEWIWSYVSATWENWVEEGSDQRNLSCLQGFKSSMSSTVYCPPFCLTHKVIVSKPLQFRSKPGLRCM